MGKLMPFQLLNNTPPDACKECARVHDADQPHDQRSLYYQYRFYDQHGRWPTWADAMAHCTEEMRQLWTKELKNYGIEV